MSEAQPINWPRRGDKAFKAPGDPRDPALVAAFVLPYPEAYAIGFKEAADRVVEAAGRDYPNPDMLFFPVAYLYRHSLELALKDVVRMSVEARVIAVPDDALRKILGEHNLLCLWERVRGAIEAFWPEADHADTDAVGDIVREFHRLDSSGQEFRYATNKAGKPHLRAAPHCVSLQGLKQTMDGVHRFLDAVCAGIDAAP